MSNETAIKFIAFIVFTAIPVVVIYNMVTTTNDCEKAANAYAEAINPNAYSPEAKTKEAEMQAVCKAMGIQAEVYLKALTPSK